MKTIAVLAALAMSLAGKPAPIHARGEGDMDKIQGTWTVSAGEKAGHKAQAGDLKDAKMTFSGGKFAWKAGGKETEGTFSVDATKTPGEISISMKDKKLAGIYRIEGDELKICIGVGDDRPTDFATKAGAKSMLLVLKREKP
jgi:uncharacterized protein (TIGR03067 family)